MRNIILFFVIMLLITGCMEEPVGIDMNTLPAASFSVSPSSGSTTTLFQFDASACNDHESTTSALQVRWDWENDGTWDTGYSTTKTASHLYSSGGTKTVKLEVKDTGGLLNSISHQIIVTSGTVTDIDGNVYNTVTIGTQTWMMENLKVTHYRNGDAIPNKTDATEWSNLTSGAYCEYDNNSANVATYGRLYNWYAVNDSRGIAPSGWHVASDEEWKQLEKYLGMSQTDADATGWRGTDEGDKLKSTSGWNYGGNGTNTSGFSAVPGGYRDYDGSFNYMGYYAYFWSSTEYYSFSAWYRLLYYYRSDVYRSYSSIKRSGFSIRCVRD